MRNHPIPLLALLLAAAPSWAAVIVPVPHRCDTEALAKLSAGSTDPALKKYLTPGGLVESSSALCQKDIYNYIKKAPAQNLAWQKATSLSQQLPILTAAEALYYGVDLAADGYFRAADAVYAAGEKLKIATVERKKILNQDAVILKVVPDPVPNNVSIAVDGLDQKQQVEAIKDVIQPDPVDSKQSRPGRTIQEFYNKAVEVIRAAHKVAPDLVKDPGETGWVKLAVKPPHLIMGTMPKVARCEGAGDACYADAAAHADVAFDRLDTGLRNRVAVTNTQVNNLFNHSYAIVLKSSNTSVAELIGKVEKAKPTEKPKTDVAGANLDIEAYKELFKKETADKLFDGIESRTKLLPDDPNYLTHDQANSLKKEYGAQLQGDKVIGVNATVTQDGNKLVYNVVGADKKPKAVPGAEAELPAALTEGAAKTQAQKVAELILKGDDLAAKAAALYGAVFVPSQGGSGTVPNITGPNTGVAGGNGSFADEVKAASCGSPLDIGKSKSELAREKMNSRIAEQAKKNSKARKGDEGAYDDEMEAAADQESDTKDNIASWYENERANIWANQTLDTAERNEALGKLSADRDGKLKIAAEKRAAREEAAKKKRDEALAQRRSKSEDLNKQQKEQDALIVADYDRRIPDELAKRKSFYVTAKKDSADYAMTADGRKELAEGVNAKWVYGEDAHAPLRPEDITAAHLTGAVGGKKLPKGGYFVEKWEGEGAKGSMTALRSELGIKPDNTLAKRIKNVSDTAEFVDEDLVNWYIERIMKPAEASRKGGK